MSPDPKIDASFGNPSVTLARLRKGEQVDVIIFAPAIADDILKEGRINPTTRVTIGKSITGLGMASSGSKPDIASKDSFIDALRSVRTIALLDANGRSATSPQVLATFELLGLMPELQPKLRFYDRVVSMGAAIVHGEADVMVAPISEIISLTGVQVVGPIPSDVLAAGGAQLAAVASGTAQREAAQRFIDFLSKHRLTPYFREDPFSGVIPKTITLLSFLLIKTHRYGAMGSRRYCELRNSHGEA